MTGVSAWVVALIALANSLVGCASVSESAASLVGKPVPEARLMLLSGEDVALRGEGVDRAILFWATWCSHSKSTIAHFEDLAREYSPRGNVEFYAVSLDKNEDLEHLRWRIKTQELDTIVHVFSGNDVQDEAYLALKGDQLPYAVFVDSRGVVRFVGTGIGGLESYLEKHFVTGEVRP
jgi:thiol-disulfide isomerase/thioredoxin